MLAKQALNFKCLFWFTGGGLGPATMAYGGVPNHTDMDDESTASAHEAAGTSLAHDLVQQLGLVSLEPSSSSTPSTSMMPPKAPTFSPDKYSLRNLEIQQTLGEWRVSLFEALMVGRNFISISTEKQGQLVYRYSEGAVFNIVHLLLYKGESSRFLGQESCKFATGGSHRSMVQSSPGCSGLHLPARSTRWVWRFSSGESGKHGGYSRKASDLTWKASVGKILI